MNTQQQIKQWGVQFDPIAQWQRQKERELLLLIASRALGVNRGELLCCLAFNAGDGGFLKIRSSNCFFI